MWFVVQTALPLPGSVLLVLEGIKERPVLAFSTDQPRSFAVLKAALLPRSDLLVLGGFRNDMSMLFLRRLTACFCSFAVGLFTTLWRQGDLDP